MALVIVCFITFLCGVSIPLNISTIGKQRRPLTHGVAIFATVVAMVEIAGLVYVASQL